MHVTLSQYFVAEKVDEIIVNLKNRASNMCVKHVLLRFCVLLVTAGMVLMNILGQKLLFSA